MARLKKNCRKLTQHRRDVLSRKAKEQSLINLEQLAVIMEVLEADSGIEDERTRNDLKKQRRNMKKCKKQSEISTYECKKNISQKRNLKCFSSEKKDLKSKKPKSPVLLSNTGALSHFMELGARTDLLCDSPVADPLGPDSFDNFQWVEVKQELPDDIEVCNVTLTELPLKTDDEKATDLNANDKDTSDAKVGTSDDLIPLKEPVPCYETEDDISSRTEQDKLSEADASTSMCEDKESEIVNIPPGGDEDCGEQLPASERLEENLTQNKRKNHPQQCDICDKKLYSKGNLRLHKLKKHKMKVQFTCELCSLKFDFQRKAVQHRNTVHRGEDGRFGCDICSKRVLDFYAFLGHIRSHVGSCKETEGSDKVCSDCDKTFQDDESLKTHRISVHNADVRGSLKSQEKNFTCDLCGRRFAFSCLLRDHINTHTGTKPYLCQECGKAFCQKSTLKQHTKTHSEVRPFQCAECPQGFYSKGDFVKHQRKHTGERPYVCEVCGEGFSRNTHLVIHRRTHTGERPHICDICDRGFTKRGDVVRHRRVHTGELPYLCQVCGKAFRQSTQCANHIKSQHPDSLVPVARNPNPLIHGIHMQLMC